MEDTKKFIDYCLVALEKDKLLECLDTQLLIKEYYEKVNNVLVLTFHNINLQKAEFICDIYNKIPIVHNFLLLADLFPKKFSLDMDQAKFIIKKKSPPDHVLKAILSFCGTYIKYLSSEKQTPELCKIACAQFGNSILYIKKKIYEYWKIACSQDGTVLQYCPYNIQTDELHRIACAQNGLSLRYVNFQDQAICKIACVQNGMSLKYCHSQYPEICYIACKRTPDALEYVYKEILDYWKREEFDYEKEFTF